MNLFDDFGPEYDEMIKWDARLKNEEPFFQKLFAEHQVERVLDLGCGTGLHVIMFAGWGIQVVGTDPSQTMIEQARHNLADKGDAALKAEFVVASFQDFPRRVTDTFDAVVVLGNSLPHILGENELADCLVGISQVLNESGILIIQNRNYDKVLESRERFMGLNSHGSGEEEKLFLRFMDFNQDLIQFNIVTMQRQQGKWNYQVLSNTLRPIRKAELELALFRAGLHRVNCFGDYQEKPFEEANSNDLIVIAVKTGVE
ncbi:MAG TPA: class I SAM-dependent methyltransferase [Bacillota bacterium]|nr:class I SAM-dependent methyltransferase [Bacillota bacterium]